MRQSYRQNRRLNWSLLNKKIGKRINLLWLPVKLISANLFSNPEMVVQTKNVPPQQPIEAGEDKKIREKTVEPACMLVVDNLPKFLNLNKFETNFFLRRLYKPTELIVVKGLFLLKLSQVDHYYCSSDYLQFPHF